MNLLKCMAKTAASVTGLELGKFEGKNVGTHVGKTLGLYVGELG